MKSKRK